jgi:LPXTG-site transpeptidase (sortase) family protein
MALHLRAAGRVDSRLASGVESRRLAGFLLAAGSIALVVGAAILFTSFAPMFMGGSDSATVTARNVSPPMQSGNFATVVAPATPSAETTPSPSPALAPSSGPIDGVTFEMRVPAIGYRAMVRNGVGSNVLDFGPGHYAGTPWPGQPGNVGVAGHNTYWLSFNRLRVGDRVEIRTQHGLYVYEINGSSVVDPNDRTVLSATSDHRLTLTTCYPLWAGVFATKRLIFTAREMGGVA